MKITGKVIIEKFNIVTEEITSTVEYNDTCYINTQLFVTGRNTSNLAIAGVTPISSQDPLSLWNIKTSSIRQKQSKINHTIKTETTSMADIGYPTWTDSVGINSQYVIYAKADGSNIDTLGFYDCYLSYTENRPFVRIGDSETLTGSYNSLFAGTTVPTLVPDESIELDYIPQVTVHKTAGEVQNTGEVKVATGSGWLIFNEADEGKSIEGSFTAHYLY